MGAGVFCIIAMFFSLFGIMHGNNYIFSNGREMFAGQHTTDLGEVMLSLPKLPHLPFLSFLPDIDTSGMGYAVNKVDGPTMYPTFGDLKWSRVCNEGWRFAIAYAALAVFCAVHAAIQKMIPGHMPAIMDNGKVDDVHDGQGLPFKTPTDAP